MKLTTSTSKLASELQLNRNAYASILEVGLLMSLAQKHAGNAEGTLCLTTSLQRALHSSRRTKRTAMRLVKLSMTKINARSRSNTWIEAKIRARTLKIF